MADGKIAVQAVDGKIYTVTPEVGASGSVSVVFPKEGGTLANETFVNTAISAIPIVKMPPPVRQTVLSGSVDTNGFSAFGGSTGSTTVTSTSTLVATCADGTNDRIGTIINPSWTGLSTDGTMYLYLDIATDGTCTTGSTTLAPTYRWGGADVVTNLQNTFNIQEMKMKVGNGATASQVYRVFVGEVKVLQDVVSNITWYALMGRYDSGIFAVTTSKTYVKTHNIGIIGNIETVTWSDDINGTNERQIGFLNGAAGSFFYAGTSDKNTTRIITYVSNTMLTTAGGGAATGFYRLRITRGW